jgi:penicillin-binding protein 1C
MARTNQLPAHLQRFRPDGLPETATAGQGDAPLLISYPPDGARIEISSDGVQATLPLKAMGGAPPFTWLADGVPVAVGEARRQANWDTPSLGFARLSVVDAKGRTASARIRLE